MAELVVLGFGSKGGAQDFLRALLPLRHEHLIQIEDDAFTIKNEAGRSRSYYSRHRALEALFQGSIWRTLAGALFLEPFFGMLIGGTAALLVKGAQTGRDCVSRRLIQETAERKLEPGHSALFLMVSRATPDKLMQRLHTHDASVISTSLSTEKEKRLREAWKSIKADGPLALHAADTTRTQPLTESPSRLTTKTGLAR